MKQPKRRNAPNGFFYRLFYHPVKWLSRRGRTVVVTTDVGSLPQGPFIVLSNHLSYWDWAFVPQAFPHDRLTLIVNRYYFRKPIMRFLLGRMKAIPKSMLYPDVETVRKTFRSIRDGHHVLMFPEARLGTDGSSQNVTAGTGALLKKLNVPVVFVELSGASFASPKWGRKPRRGPVEIAIRKVAEPSEFTALSDAAADAFFTANILHDEAAYVRRSGAVYRSSDLTAGLDAILYVCPQCGGEFTLEAGNGRIVCRSCGFEAVLGNDYVFTSSMPSVRTIRDWNLLQVAHEQERYDDGTFAFSVGVTVRRMDLSDPRNDTDGTGVVNVTKQGLFFTGTIGGAEESFSLPSERLEGIPFRADEEFEFYHRGFLHFFYPTRNPHVCAKVSLAGDVIVARRKLGTAKSE